MSDINHTGDEPLVRKPIYEHTIRDEFDLINKRLDRLERTLEGMQVLLGKASEYKARPRRERLP